MKPILSHVITTKQSTTNPWSYYMGQTLLISHWESIRNHQDNVRFVGLPCRVHKAEKICNAFLSGKSWLQFDEKGRTKWWMALLLNSDIYILFCRKEGPRMINIWGSCSHSQDSSRKVYYSKRCRYGAVTFHRKSSVTHRFMTTIQDYSTGTHKDPFHDNFTPVLSKNNTLS